MVKVSRQNTIVSDTPLAIFKDSKTGAKTDEKQEDVKRFNRQTSVKK